MSEQQQIVFPDAVQPKPERKGWQFGRRANVQPESMEAYDAIKGGRAKLHAEILEFFRSRGGFGATADEVAQHFRCQLNHTSPRLTELLKLGKLVRTSDRRRTRAGHSAAVLRAT